MSALTRGFRNVYRNQVRTLIVIAILSLSIAVFLTMVIVDEGVNQEIEEVEMSVGTEIEVRPAGSYGGFSVGKRPGGGGGQEGETEYLDEDVVDVIEDIDHVDEVHSTVTQMDFDMRAVITGQIGMDKKPYLEAVASMAGQRGGRIDVFHLGDMMYDEEEQLAALHAWYELWAGPQWLQGDPRHMRLGIELSF